jgi:tRNA threonylcarbamoyladenosine biosynthesis protein TsaE
MISAVLRTVTVADEAATGALARAIAALAQPCDVITLSGTLGAGKTSFARSFIAASGGGEEVPSPTFTLLQVYETPGAAIYHFDLYRLENAEDAFEVGIEDAFADGISLIEWPDRLGRYLPRERLDVTIFQGAHETERRFEFAASVNWAQRLNEASLPQASNDV